MKQPDATRKSTLSKYLNPTTIIATTALFFALGGAAYATDKYVITSTAQVKPSVLSALHGQPGLPGSKGPAGGTGAIGAAGTNGANGKDGATGPTGAAGTNGVNGKDGATGAAGSAGLNGKDGVNGKDGWDGVNGKDGATGPTGAAGIQGATGNAGATGPTGATGTPGATGNDGATGPAGATGSDGAAGAPGVNGLNPATPVLQSGDAGWTLSGVDPVTGNTAAFTGGALHLYGGFDGSTYQGGIGIAKAYSEPLSSFSSIGFSFVINQSANADTPVVHVTLVGATADSHFASGFTNLVYVPAFNGVTERDATVDGFAQGNEWYSTDEPGGLSAPGGQDNPRPISFFQTNEPTATIIQISLDNGNSSTGTIPYGSEDFSADDLIVGFGDSFTRYDLGG